MKLVPSLVAVRKIQTQTPRSLFDAAALDDAARLILKTGALVVPLIVGRNGVDRYVLLDGEFAYHASVRAKELDPVEGEMVLAFIVEPDSEENFKQQASFLRPAGTEKADETDIALLGPRFSSMEQRTEQWFTGYEKTLAEIQKELRKEICRLDQHLPKQVPALELLNQDPPPELLRLLNRIKVKNAGQVVENIIRERGERLFDSLKDVEKRKLGLTAVTLLSLIDCCVESTFVPIPASGQFARATVN